MNSDIAQLLSETGPTLSSALVKKLSRNGISQVAARQRISRARGIKRLQGLSFPNREQFLFLSKHAGKQEFFDNLLLALKENRTSYGRVITALEARGGAIPLTHFPAASGLPVENAKGQLSSAKVLQQLQSVELITITSTPDGDIVGLRNSPVLSNRRRATLIVEDVTLGVIRPWLVNLGWSSSKSLAVRSPRITPKFGQFRFDLVGPSYLNSITDYRHARLLNGFIVADVLLDRQISLKDLDPFLAKLAVLWNQKRSTRFQSMFIADRFDSDALNLLRKTGCVIGRPENIFGLEIANHLKDLVSTLERAADAVTKDPTAVFTLMRKIAKIEGASQNLRGVVLELIVAHLLRLDGYNIDIRQQIRSIGGDLAEIDVRASKRNEVICIECKGKSPSALVGRNEIEYWVKKTIPRIKSWLKRKDENPSYRRFEFYASTDYDEEASALIRELTTPGEESINFYRGKDLIRKLRENRENSLIDIFREQFGDQTARP